MSVNEIVGLILLVLMFSGVAILSVMAAMPGTFPPLSKEL
jgi:hypothetical protein